MRFSESLCFSVAVSVMSFTLYTEPGGTLFETFQTSHKDLKAKVVFKQAVVTSGTWVFFSFSNYNACLQGNPNPGYYRTIVTGGTYDISSFNGSMFLVENAGFILFEQPNFGGKRV